MVTQTLKRTGLMSGPFVPQCPRHLKYPLLGSYNLLSQPLMWRTHSNIVAHLNFFYLEGGGVQKSYIVRAHTLLRDSCIAFQLHRTTIHAYFYSIVRSSASNCNTKLQKRDSPPYAQSHDYPNAPPSCFAGRQ